LLDQLGLITDKNRQDMAAFKSQLQQSLPAITRSTQQ
jgi:hypothetical protein